MSKQYKIVLTDAAYNLLLEKSKEAKETIHETAEALIMEFSQSTPEEWRKINELSIKIRDKFISSHENATPTEIWGNGCRAGWKLFQLRKENSRFKKYKKQLEDWENIT